MNSIFKELYDSGRIDQTPVFECGGKKGYQFAGNGMQISQGRFDEYASTMRSYEAFRLDVADVDLSLELLESQFNKIVTYQNDPKSIQKLAIDGVGIVKELNQRREYSLPLGRLYAQLSFVIVEEDENPMIYDTHYNKDKIERWQNDLTMEKKILLLPILLPIFPDLSKLFQEDSLNFIRNLNAKERDTAINHLTNGDPLKIRELLQGTFVDYHRFVSARHRIDEQMKKAQPKDNS
jgi:hypothetical protein